MIKNINAIEAYQSLKENKDSKLIDVRAAGEWKNDGCADLKSINNKIYLISWVNDDGSPNDMFIDQIKNLNIKQTDKLYCICRSGVRSQHAGSFLKNYFNEYNIFNIEGGMEFGWKLSDLPIKI